MPEISQTREQLRTFVSEGGHLPDLIKVEKMRGSDWDSAFDSPYKSLSSVSCGQLSSGQGLDQYLVVSVVDGLRRSASQKVQEFFRDRFVKCNDDWVAKGRQTLEWGPDSLGGSGRSPRILPVYWFIQYKDVSGPEIDRDSIKKFEGADKLNKPEIEWEANLEIKAKYLRYSSYKEPGFYADFTPDRWMIFVDYKTGKWEEWKANYGAILSIKLWKTMKGEWEINSVEYGNIGKAPRHWNYSSAIAVETTLRKPTCEEAERLIPSEIISLSDTKQ